VVLTVEPGAIVERWGIVSWQEKRKNRHKSPTILVIKKLLEDIILDPQ
jgi:hypothetical protein